MRPRWRSWARQARGLLHEAIASARSQPVASAVTIIMVLGVIVAVMLTTGRTVGAEQKVIATIDSQGTRTITIRTQPDANVSSDVVSRLGGIDGIEWAGAFSFAEDSRNSALTDGTLSPVRLLYTNDVAPLGIPSTSAVPGGVAWASKRSLDILGMPDASGSVTLSTGASYAVVGELHVPEFLAPLEPLIVVPEPASNAAPVGQIVVVAKRPELIGAVTAAAMSVTAPADATKVTVETSQNLVDLRGLIQGQLGSFGRQLVLGLLAVTGALLAVLLFSLVMMRRKDFGRRRALGASRGLIISLLLAQTGILAGVGILLGLVGSTVLLLALGDPLPGVAFVGALSLLTLLAALLAAVAPAVAASRRDPLRELRVA